MQILLAKEFPGFLDALGKRPVSGLRVNTLKITRDEFQLRTPFPPGEQIPWARDAFVLGMLDSSPGNHPYHQAGLYYLQDPSAMMPAVVLDPQPGECILDLAAAPGGKTTQLSTLMAGKGFLLANEIKKKRLGHLILNVERWGAGNTVISNETPERLAEILGPVFDRVLVDAPCSGEGMFRKDMGARQDWSEEMIAGCAARQKIILRSAVRLVRPGGYLLYSTCTFAPEENEEVILDLLVHNPEFSVVVVGEFPGFTRGRPDWIRQPSATQKTSNSLAFAVRLFPHLVNGEGHFACLLKKGGTKDLIHHPRHTNQPRPPERLQMALWLEFLNNALSVEFPEERLLVRGDKLYLVPEMMLDLTGLNISLPGVWLGTFKKDRFEPAHPLALTLPAGKAKRVIDLAPNDPRLQSYLHGEIIEVPGEQGWVLITVDGYGIGWGKRVQGRIKNHYPRGWMQGSGYHG